MKSSEMRIWQIRHSQGLSLLKLFLYKILDHYYRIGSMIILTQALSALGNVLLLYNLLSPLGLQTVSQVSLLPFPGGNKWRLEV